MNSGNSPVKQTLDQPDAERTQVGWGFWALWVSGLAVSFILAAAYWLWWTAGEEGVLHQLGHRSADSLIERYQAGKRSFFLWNLSEEDLSGFDLSGADLSEATLSKADLSGADGRADYSRICWQAISRRGREFHVG